MVTIYLSLIGPSEYVGEYLAFSNTLHYCSCIVGFHSIVFGLKHWLLRAAHEIFVLASLVKVTDMASHQNFKVRIEVYDVWYFLPNQIWERRSSLSV